jgi:predicted alpha/beta superfamily hydrolase
MIPFSFQTEFLVGPSHWGHSSAIAKEAPKQTKITKQISKRVFMAQSF